MTSVPRLSGVYYCPRATRMAILEDIERRDIRLLLQLRAATYSCELRAALILLSGYAG